MTDSANILDDSDVKADPLIAEADESAASPVTD